MNGTKTSEKVLVERADLVKLVEYIQDYSNVANEATTCGNRGDPVGEEIESIISKYSIKICRICSQEKCCCAEREAMYGKGR